MMHRRVPRDRLQGQQLDLMQDHTRVQLQRV